MAKGNKFKDEQQKEIQATEINWDDYGNEIKVITNQCKSFKAGIEYTVTKEIAKILVSKGNVTLK